MKTITILTLFPSMFDGFLTNSIILRAIANKLVDIKIINIRDFSKDKYNRVDTPPIGGGAGLIMKCQPIYDCLVSLDYKNKHVILMSPKGKTYSQNKAKELAKIDKDIIIICGHYEGIDERINKYVDELISIGDFILTGGELASMVISDSVIRLLDGAISHESIVEESFDDNLLEYPQYTEPYDFLGDKVPDILYSGNHTAIKKYRRKESLRLTKNLRPDLYQKITLTKKDKELLKEIEEGNDNPEWIQKALQKGHKFIKN